MEIKTFFLLSFAYFSSWLMTLWGLHSIIATFFCCTKLFDKHHSHFTSLKFVPRNFLLHSSKIRQHLRSKRKKNVALFAHLQCYLFLRSHFIVCHFLYSHNKQCVSLFLSSLSMSLANNSLWLTHNSQFQVWSVEYEK